MNLSKNFTLNEFLRSDTASRYKIDNKPNEEQLDNLSFVAEQLEIIRSYYNKPIFISSGFRTKELNTLLKGSKTSQHMQGLAVDINLKTKDENKIFFNHSIKIFIKLFIFHKKTGSASPHFPKYSLVAKFPN